MKEANDRAWRDELLYFSLLVLQYVTVNLTDYTSLLKCVQENSVPAVVIPVGDIPAPDNQGKVPKPAKEEAVRAHQQIVFI